MSSVGDDGFEIGETLSERIERERQTVREPLEARVRELERQLADMLESSLQPETYDQQAVRELLVLLDGSIASQSISAAAHRVRESEKKRREGGADE